MARIKNDHYPTPAWMTHCLIKYANIPLRSRILEPCAGKDKAIARIFLEQNHPVWTNDKFYDNCHDQLDATTDEAWEQLTEFDPDWIITNPPFNQQQQILERAYEAAKVGVAFLMRVTADEMVVSEKHRSRVNWWTHHPESLVIKMPRFSFARSSKTDNFAVDSAYCQWFAWRKDGHQYPCPVIRLPADQIPHFHRKPIEENQCLLIPNVS